MPEPNGPQIQPAVLPFGGEGIQIVADANPKLCPLGLDLVISEPGQLAILGRGVLPAGCMLAIVPPGMSANLRRELQKALAKQAHAKPPGLAGPPGIANP